VKAPKLGFSACVDFSVMSVTPCRQSLCFGMPPTHSLRYPLKNSTNIISFSLVGHALDPAASYGLIIFQRRFFNASVYLQRTNTALEQLWAFLSISYCLRRVVVVLSFFRGCVRQKSIDFLCSHYSSNERW